MMKRMERREKKTLQPGVERQDGPPLHPLLAPPSVAGLLPTVPLKLKDTDEHREKLEREGERVREPEKDDLSR
jgi:hypothetical protein